MSYWILFGWCFLAASLVPISSEPYYMLLVAEEGQLLWPVLVAALGNTLGGITTFLVGRWGAKYYQAKKTTPSEKDRTKTRAWVKKWGPITMLVSWVPLLGDVVVGIGGALELAVAPSVFWMTIGKLGRYWLLGRIALELT